MGKMVAVFQSQASADTAVEQLNRLGLNDMRTAVYEGVSQDHPTGTDTIPNTGFAGIPGAFRPTGTVPPFLPFKDLDLDLDDDENEEFFQRMYEQGATLVFVEASDDDMGQITRVLSQNGGRFSREG